MLRNLIERDEGMSLTELLVTSSLLVVVLATSWMVLNTMTRAANATAARQIAEDEARTAVTLTSRDIRQAVEIVDAGGAFVRAEPRDCWFYADVDADGVPELVKYVIVGRELKRQIIETSATPPDSPADFTSAEPTKSLAQSIDASWTTAMFSYWSTGTVPIAKNTSTQDDIASVEIRFVTKAKQGQETAVADENTWVKIRSLFSNLD